jgi:hypothetical protein
MKTRKRKGKQHAQTIIDFLHKQSSINDGWIQVKDIQAKLVKSKRIPEGPTLFRILSGLYKEKIIEKDPRVIPTKRMRPNKQKISVFYRLSYLAYFDSILTPEERDNADHDMKIRMHEQQLDLIVAKKVLENHCLTEEFEQMKKSDEFANYREFIEDYR